MEWTVTLQLLQIKLLFSLFLEAVNVCQSCQSLFFQCRYSCIGSIEHHVLYRFPCDGIEDNIIPSKVNVAFGFLQMTQRNILYHREVFCVLSRSKREESWKRASLLSQPRSVYVNPSGTDSG